jgi:hypothetical protein
MEQERAWEQVELISSDDQSVGEVSEVIWSDAAGYDIVAVGEYGSEVAVPVQASEPTVKVVVGFTAEEVRSGPRVEELSFRGGEEAVIMVEQHYNVPLSGPPPGPSPQPLPPWWRKKHREEPDQPSTA